jgi:hypothetical protein
VSSPAGPEAAAGAGGRARFGKFGYEAQEDGNCMSYALRDRDMILYDDLIDDTPAFQASYDTGGIGGALQYLKNRVSDYVERHSAELQIGGIREIDGFRAPIDENEEYRIAMRIGFRDRNMPLGIQVDSDFDYHFWAQVSDGSWAEKTPDESSRLAPGSNSGLNPGKYPWNQGYMWGYDKWNDYYTSDTIYFAVKKTTAAFTSHRGASARRQ